MEAAKKTKSRRTTEFGDFQTPPELALAATEVLRDLGVRPQSIVEPTCGRGAFLRAAAGCFPEAKSIIGVDINQDHLRFANMFASRSAPRIDLWKGDFFKMDWGSIVTSTGEPWLIIGNPPWVTSSDLAAIESDNLPEKSNFHGRSGIEAITGKSNFDISEWMLLRYLDWLESANGTIAVLCKTAVARKVLLHIWKHKRTGLGSARIYKIDAFRSFGASVDACFFVLEIQCSGQARECEIFASLNAGVPTHTIGFADGHIVPQIAAFNKHRGLAGPESRYVWRSGIKHDCSKVMELAITPGGYRNGLGETVEIEDRYLFPLLKSSDIANGRTKSRAAMIVTQTFVGENTAPIETHAPMTWRYLERHAELLDKRGSSIYRNKPRYSIFGVGPYTFAPWKVAISGFYKRLNFMKIGSPDGKASVFDDTVNFLPCWSEEEADFIVSLLRSKQAQEFLTSIIHWDEKRPVTIEVLKRLSIERLAAIHSREQEYAYFTECQNLPLFAAQ
jgi:methylase of polypeptide subunit release factors